MSWAIIVSTILQLGLQMYITNQFNITRNDNILILGASLFSITIRCLPIFGLLTILIYYNVLEGIDWYFVVSIAYFMSLISLKCRYLRLVRKVKISFIIDFVMRWLIPIILMFAIYYFDKLNVPILLCVFILTYFLLNVLLYSILKYRFTFVLIPMSEIGNFSVFNLLIGIAEQIPLIFFGFKDMNAHAGYFKLMLSLSGALHAIASVFNQSHLRQLSIYRTKPYVVLDIIACNLSKNLGIIILAYIFLNILISTTWLRGYYPYFAPASIVLLGSLCHCLFGPNQILLSFYGINKNLLKLLIFLLFISVLVLVFLVDSLIHMSIYYVCFSIALNLLISIHLLINEQQTLDLVTLSSYMQKKTGRLRG